MRDHVGVPSASAPPGGKKAGEIKRETERYNVLMWESERVSE